MGAGLSRILLLVAGLLSAAPAPARAQDLPRVVVKHGTFRQENGQITLSVGFREMFSPAMRRRLQSGFATTVVMRIHLFSADGARTVAFSARTLRAVYDLWKEHYLLHIEEPGRRLTRRLRGQKAVVDRLTSLWRFPVASVAEVRPGERYFVAVIAEVNPVRESLLSEVRSWLRNPQGRGQSLGDQSFFGSFVSIFVNNKIRRAEKTFRLRTQAFFRRP